MKRTCCLLLLLAVLLPSGSRQAQADEGPGPPNPDAPVMVFPYSGYLPFFSGERGKTITEYAGFGMLVDLLDDFEQAHPGHAFQRVRLPRSRADQWLEWGWAKAYALHSPFFDDSLGENFVFSDPVWSTADHIFVRDGFQLRYERPEDLRGVRMGLILGFSYGPLDPLLKSGEIPSVRVSTDRQLYGLLLDGRVDAIVANRHVLPYSMGLYGMDRTRLHRVDPALYDFDLCVLLREDLEDTLRVFNAFLRQARGSGLLDEIERRWLDRGCPGPR